MIRVLSLIGAPSSAGAYAAGQEKAPDAFRRHGLVSALTQMGPVSPMVRDGDVVAFGRRDAEDAAAHGSQRIEDTEIRVLDLPTIRAHGAVGAAKEAVEHLSRPELAGFWMHLDADVLDDGIMPAVDYRMPGGLSWDELAATLRTGVASGRAVGLNVTIFNPKLDADGSIATAFVSALTQGLRR